MKTTNDTKDNITKTCKNCKYVLRLIALGFGWRCSLKNETIPTPQICELHEFKEPDQN